MESHKNADFELAAMQANEIKDQSAPIKSMYQTEWVQALLAEIKSCLKENKDWIGIDATTPQRVLDYACGNGTVSTGLLSTFALATFCGLDKMSSQVELFNEEALKALGERSQRRMFAVQGDLLEAEKYPHLSDDEWYNFDVAIVSFALHHIDDPIGFLEILRGRVKAGGTVVVLGPLRENNAMGGGELQAKATGSKYDVKNMAAVPMGRIWPGFSIDDVREDFAAAGYIDAGVRVWQRQIEVPQHGSVGGKGRMYISRASVP